MSGLPDHIKNIYYRGLLNSCNYSCSYCSFAKGSSSGQLLEKDENMLRQFHETIRCSGQGLRIMILPYGEALIHSYYSEGIINLASLPNVLGISCQTNLSFDPKRFLNILPTSIYGKIKFWASFHPEMVTIENFLEKVHYLFNNGIELCVGVVGHLDNKEIIKQLRSKLNPSIYMFINSMRGVGHKLKMEDIDFFMSVDNLFNYDRKAVKADIQKCKGGKDTIFIDERGNCHACPRSGIKMTDFPVCDKKVCDCYIAYSNNHATLQDIMGSGLLWRIPRKREISAIFFDIDGTLTDSDEKIPDSYIKSLTLFSAKIPLFLATALPLSYAKSKLGTAMQMFSGGVFADGAHLLVNDEEEYIILDPPDIDNKHYGVSTYRNKEEKVYKLAITAETEEAANILYNKYKGIFNAFVEGCLLTIVNKNADKQAGVLAICKKKDIDLSRVVVMGNSLHDWPMMSEVGYPCAVLNSCDELKARAKMTLNPDQLAIYFDSCDD